MSQKNIIMTVRDLITRAARLSKVLGQGEELSSEEAFNALQSLNEILDKWRIEKMMISGYNVYELNLTGKDYYTIGDTGDVNYMRPSFGLDDIYYIEDGRSYPIEIIGIDKYNSLRNKSLSLGRPIYAYYENDLNMAKLYVYPISSKGKVVLTFDKVFDLFDSLDSIISFPPAYMRAFRYALAVEFCREYGIVEDPILSATVFEAKSLIKDSNVASRLPLLNLDNF